jgi:cardiolipin synthase
VYSWIIAHWPASLAAVVVMFSLWAAIHAVLKRRDDRATLGWVAVILFVPILGALFYALFGINHVRRRGARIRPRMNARKVSADHSLVSEDLEIGRLPGASAHLAVVARLVERLTRRPLLDNNAARVLDSGDNAYEAMLAAIEGAQRSITLSSYIFDADEVGKRFAAALERATKRGVEVRVLVDAVGLRYGWPGSIVRELRRREVPVAAFLPAHAPWNLAHVNLRNHRKILVCDGVVGFTGGINIRDNHRSDSPLRRQALDVHFELRGPVVSQLQESFATDWRFTTGEALDGGPWFVTTPEPAGNVVARGISDGPDEDIDVLPYVLFGAIGAATRSVRIVTPYFVPDRALIDALCASALGGVNIDIVLPRHPNLPWMTRAAMTRLELLVLRGCNVYLSPRPFDHAKLLTVDGAWTLIGSGNWDTRSLALNFEQQVECYDTALVAQINALIDQRVGRSDRLTRRFFESRSLGTRVVDGTLRLLSPLL